MSRLLQALVLARTFLRISALNELQYRVNFFMELVQSLLALGTGLAVLALVFSHTRELAGWSQAELLAVMGVHILVGGVVRTAIQPNMLRLIEDVRDGKLDYLLTKPRDGQLLVSVRQLNVWQSVDCLVGAIVLGIAVVRLRASSAWGRRSGSRRRCRSACWCSTASGSAWPPGRSGSCGWSSSSSCSTGSTRRGAGRSGSTLWGCGWCSPSWYRSASR